MITREQISQNWVEMSAAVESATPIISLVISALEQVEDPDRVAIDALAAAHHLLHMVNLSSHKLLKAA